MGRKIPAPIRNLPEEPGGPRGVAVKGIGNFGWNNNNPTYPG